MQDSSYPKKCKICNAVKSRSEFYRVRSNKDGLSTWCKSCDYQKSRQRRDRLASRFIILTPERKNCRKCGETKTSAEFHKNKMAPDGLTPLCSHCANASNATHRRLHPTKSLIRRAHDMNHAPPNITDEELIAFIASHYGLCDLPSCGRKAKHTDHDHRTGHIRGRLCHTHNLAFGKFGDSITGLQEAIDYLKKSEPFLTDELVERRRRKAARINNTQMCLDLDFQDTDNQRHPACADKRV
jgi:Recombination endonuclease VII